MYEIRLLAILRNEFRPIVGRSSTFGNEYSDAFGGARGNDDNAAVPTTRKL